MRLNVTRAVMAGAFLAALLVSGCESRRVDVRQAAHPDALLAGPSRPWAVQIEKPGLPNLHRVSNDLYRGAQPTAEGFRQLEAMGVKTVINLRWLSSDREALAGTGLGYEEISMKAWHPEDEDAVQFLRIVSDRSRAPFFVHCHHGADRTGMLCAVYRIAIQGWTKDEAIAEMTQGDFGFHGIWKDIVTYIRELDVEKLKREAFSSAAPTK